MRTELEALGLKALAQHYPRVTAQTAMACEHYPWFTDQDIHQYLWNKEHRANWWRASVVIGLGLCGGISAILSWHGNFSPGSRYIRFLLSIVIPLVASMWMIEWWMIEGTKKYHWEWIPLSDYDRGIPQNALQALQQAQERHCFDAFRIAQVRARWIDPLIIGEIHGDPRHWVIAHWDRDIDPEQLCHSDRHVSLQELLHETSDGH